jgi:hypothetical protein
MAGGKHDRGDLAATWASDATEATTPGDAEHNAVGARDDSQPRVVHGL